MFDAIRLFNYSLDFVGIQPSRHPFIFSFGRFTSREYNFSASESFDSTYPTNVVVTSEGLCTYIPPGIHLWRTVHYTNMKLKSNNKLFLLFLESLLQRKLFLRNVQIFLSHRHHMVSIRWSKLWNEVWKLDLQWIQSMYS